MNSSEPTLQLLMGAVVSGYVYFTSLYLQGVLHFSVLLTASLSSRPRPS